MLAKNRLTFVHTSDWQPNRSYRLATGEIQNVRAKLFDKLEIFLRHVRRWKPDLFLFAGDLFRARVDDLVRDPCLPWTKERFTSLRKLLTQIHEVGTSLYFVTGSHDEDVISHSPEWCAEFFATPPWDKVFRFTGEWEFATDPHGVAVAGFGGLGGSRDRKENYEKAVEAYRRGPELTPEAKGLPLVILSASDAIKGREQWRRICNPAYVALGSLEGSLERRAVFKTHEAPVCIQGCPFLYYSKTAEIRTLPVVVGEIDREQGPSTAKLINPETWEDWPTAV
jgi:hypothetical protein